MQANQRTLSTGSAGKTRLTIPDSAADVEPAGVGDT